MVSDFGHTTPRLFAGDVFTAIQLSLALGNGLAERFAGIDEFEAFADDAILALEGSGSDLLGHALFRGWFDLQHYR
jgi:hypothetical protein